MKQPPANQALFLEVKDLIESAKKRAATAVNSEITLLYWNVGKRIATEVLKNDRAAYGEQTIPILAQQLTAAFGKGWSKRNLATMVKFYRFFPDIHILQTLSAKLSWSHFTCVLATSDEIKRDFYLTMAIQEHWSTRTLKERMDSQLFERTAISKKPEETIARELAHLKDSGKLHQDLVLKDPYVLEFLDLNDSYLERDLEDAILRELQQFLLELGTGFTFVARQYRIQVDDDDYYIDLLFYNRKLKRLIAIDLKTSSFKPEYKGQMELYLRWLAKYEQEPDEALPLGIILCSSKKQEQIELLELDQTGIHVAEYLQALPPREVLEEKVHQARERAKRTLR